MPLFRYFNNSEFFRGSNKYWKLYTKTNTKSIVSRIPYKAASPTTEYSWIPELLNKLPDTTNHIPPAWTEE